VLLRCWDFVTWSLSVGFLTQHSGFGDGGSGGGDLKLQHLRVHATQFTIRKHQLSELPVHKKLYKT